MGKIYVRLFDKKDGGVKMEIKSWTYEEYPGYTEQVPGAVMQKTTGDEVGVRYLTRRGICQSQQCASAPADPGSLYQK